MTAMSARRYVRGWADCGPSPVSTGAEALPYVPRRPKPSFIASLSCARLRPTDMCSAMKAGFHNLAMKRSDDQYVGAAQEVVSVDDG